MSIRQTIIVLGCFLIIQPFLGFTMTIDMIINIVIGLMIILLAYKIFPVVTSDSTQKKSDLPFVEHRDSNINNTSVSEQ